MQWEKMVADHPEILVGSTNKYQNGETTDPERWVPHGYAILRVDSRGAGWSPGVMDPRCPRETYQQGGLAEPPEDMTKDEKPSKDENANHERKSRPNPNYPDDGS